MDSNNLAYFTLDEDSDVEEYVADDPNIQKKVFWYDLVEKTISSTSRASLLINALASTFGLFLQWKLFITFIQSDLLEYFGWSACIVLFAGTLNLLVTFFRRDRVPLNNTIVEQRRFTLRGRHFVLILRQICSFILIVPIYNLFYYWAESSRNEKDLKRPLVMRSQPQPTKQEIVSVQKVYEGVLEKSYLQLIESYLKFIPFALAQVCILVHHKEDKPVQGSATLEETENVSLLPGHGIVVCIIVWSLFEISWKSTAYANAQFNYAKSLQFQDLRESEVPMKLSKVSYLNSGFHLLHNLFSATFRLYCLALLLVIISYWVIPFIFLLWFSFYCIVVSMPTRSRLRLENPPKGLSTFSSDFISRGMNLFCSPNIKQECFIHFTYLFTILYFIPRVWFIASEWTRTGGPSINISQELITENFTSSSYYTDGVLDMNTTTEIYQKSSEFDSDLDLDLDPEELISNLTRIHLVYQCQNANMSVPIPILDTIVGFLMDVIVYLTKNCSTKRNILQNDMAVMILLIVQYGFSLFYLAKATSRILFELEFPAQIAQKYWTQWMNKEWDFNDIFEVKKILLCMVMSDSDLNSLANKSSGCRYLPCLNSKSNRETLLTDLWEKYVAKTNIISVNQERMKLMVERRKKLRNTSQCDVALNQFLDFLWENFVLEDDTVRMILFALQNFDENIVKSNSLRLTHIQQVLEMKESIWK